MPKGPRGQGARGQGPGGQGPGARGPGARGPSSKYSTKEPGPGAEKYTPHGIPKRIYIYIYVRNLLFGVCTLAGQVVNIPPKSRGPGAKTCRHYRKCGVNHSKHTRKTFKKIMKSYQYQAELQFRGLPQPPSLLFQILPKLPKCSRGTAAAPGTLLWLQGHCYCGYRDTTVATGTLLWLQGHCCCCTRYMFPVYLEEGPHLKNFRADLQNTWVWGPGMALDGSGLQNKAGRWS